MIELALRSALKPVGGGVGAPSDDSRGASPLLPEKQPAESGPWSENIPAVSDSGGSRTSLLGAASRPRIPAARTVQADEPQDSSLTVPMTPFRPGPSNGRQLLGLQGAQSGGKLLGRNGPQPTRPDVMPTREDFPAKPEVGGWKKILGLGLATLAGPGMAGPLTENILHGQER